MGEEDPFEVLELDERASQKDVESAFRRKSLACHPDRHPNDPTARVRFDRLSRAKESLLDPEGRKAAEYFRTYGTAPPVLGALQPKGKGKAAPPGQWVDRGAFRSKAPTEQKRAEAERIQKADEESFRRYEEKRREEAMMHIRASTGGKLGTADGGNVSMEEARRAFAERMEKEVDPKVKRQQRAQEERRQREEESKLWEEAQRQVKQEWRQRELQQAERTRRLNEDKQRHWESWGASEDVRGHVPMSPLAGTWLYGKKPNVYCIRERVDGTLHFSGPDPNSSGRLCGILVVDGEWHEVELTTSHGQPFGRMRFLFVTGDEGEEGLVSQFQKAGKSDWGREIFARRDGATLQPGGEARASSSSCGVGEDTAAVAEATLSASTPAVVDAFLNVCVTVDRSLGLSMEVAVRRGSTVLELRERLAAHDPRGSTRVEDFTVGLASVVCGEKAQPLPDMLELTQEHVALDLICLASEPSADPDQPAPADATAEESEADPPSDLLLWLRAHRLEDYHVALVERGCASLSDLLNAELARQEELIALLEMKPGHAMRFRRRLREGSVAK